MAKDIRLGRVVFDFEAKTREFRQGVRDARNALWKFNRDLRPIMANLRRFALAATGGATAIAFAGSRIAAQIDGLAKFSRSINATVGDYQILTRAAELNGIAQQKLEVSFKKLSVVLGDLSAGAAYAETVRAFERLNLSIADIINLPLVDQFTAITQAVRQYIPAAEQAAVMGELFGTRNANAIRLIDLDSINRATREFREYGGVLQSVAAREVEAMNDQLDEVKNALRIFSIQIVATHAPAIRRWAEEVAESLKPGGRLRRLLVGLAEALRLAALALTEFVLALRQVFSESTLAVIAIAGLSSAFLSTTITLAKLATGLGSVVFELVRVATGAQSVGRVWGLLRHGMGGIFSVLTVGGIAISSLIAAYNLWNGAQEESTEEARVNSDAVATLTQGYENLQRAMTAASGAQKQLTAAARESLAADIERIRLQATFEEAGIMASPEFTALSDEIKRLQKGRADLLAARDRAFESAAGATTTRGMYAQQIRERNEAALAEISEALRAAQDKRKRLFNNVDMLRAEADDFAQRLADSLLGTDSGEGPLNRGDIASALGAVLREYEDRLQDFNRAFEDNMGVSTQVFDELRSAHRWYQDITQEINDAGAGFEHLHEVAAATFADMTRRAQGLHTPLEQMVMIVDTIRDRFRAVTDSIVDHWISGTAKISDAFKQMAIQIVKDMLWMNVRAGLSRIGQGIFAGLAGAGAAVPGASPTLALGNAGTINVSGVPGFARGGMHRGGWAMVGERGPELAHFGSPARIYNSAQSRAMMGGSVAVDVQVSAGRNWQEFHSNVIRAIDAKAPDIVNAANASVMQNMQRSSNMQDALRRGM